MKKYIKQEQRKAHKAILTDKIKQDKNKNWNKKDITSYKKNTLQRRYNELMQLIYSLSNV